MARVQPIGDRKLPSVRISDINASEGVITVKPSMAFINEAAKVIRPYKNLPYFMKPALEKLADYVREEMIPETFEKEGPGWAPLSRRTQAQRLIDGFSPDHPILIQTGDLLEELTNRSHPKHIEIIKTGTVARIEIGGSSNKFIENQTGTGHPNLPARPMIPGTGYLVLPPRHKKAMRDILESAIFGVKAKFRG